MLACSQGNILHMEGNVFTYNDLLRKSGRICNSKIVIAADADAVYAKGASAGIHHSEALAWGISQNHIAKILGRRAYQKLRVITQRAHKETSVGTVAQGRARGSGAAIGRITLVTQRANKRSGRIIN